MRKVFVGSVVTIVCVIALLEILFRIAGVSNTISERRGQGFYTYYGQHHPTWFLRWMPNDTFILDHGEFQYEFITNSLGYREKDMVFSEDADVKILAFGDSFTEGIGADSSETWPIFFQMMLASRYPDKKIEVLNFGHAGSDPFYYLKELEANGLSLNPTNVIVGTGASDFDDFIFRGGEERFLEDGSTRYKDGPGFLNIYKHSRVFRFVIHNFLGYRQDILVKASHISELDQAAASSISDCLHKMNTLCDAEGVRFLAFTHPHPYEVCHMDYNDMRIRLMEDLPKEYDLVEIATSFSIMKTDPDCMSYSWPIDGHYNHKGYEKMAEFLTISIDQALPGYWE